MKRNTLNSKTSGIGSIIACVIELVVGILLLINPIGFTRGIIVAVGIILLLAGAAQIVMYFGTNALEAISTQGIVKGLIFISLGIFCVSQTGWFLTTFKVLTLLYGIIVLIIGFIRVQHMVDMIRLKQKQWIMAGLSALVAIVFSLIVIFNPLISASVLWLFISISLLLDATLDVIIIITKLIRKKK